MQEQLVHISEPVEAAGRSNKTAYLSFAIIGVVLVLDTLLILRIMGVI